MERGELRTIKLVKDQQNLNPILQDLLTLVDLANVPKQGINDSITMSGTTAATTTTYMQYAYNVVSTATATNYAARLPTPPVKGQTCTIVNVSGFPIVIYPSVTGGSINGVVNGSALIPSDGKPYTFFCYENPLPGAWTWTPPATNQIVFPTLSVAHTNGVADTKYSTDGSVFDSSIAVGTDGTSLLLTGSSWKPSNGASFTKMKVYSNIQTVDGAFNYSFFLIIAYMSGSSAVQAQILTFSRNGSGNASVLAGTVNSPAIIGDTGTIYNSSNLITSVAFPTSTPVFYTFGISIPSGMATKTYSFAPYIEFL